MKVEYWAKGIDGTPVQYTTEEDGYCIEHAPYQDGIAVLVWTRYYS